MVTGANRGIKAESLTRIELSSLTQCELHSLSLCSSSSFNLHSTQNTLIPQIDRSLFNESAGSRRQIYSPSSAPARRPRLHTPLSLSSSPDNKSIINTLKLLLSHGHTSILPQTKRKRNRNKNSNEVGVRLERVNKNGVVVDFEALGNADGVYGAEVWRRSNGLGTEEEVLGFVNALEGQWCSRRKKRKIVDAALFGEALPVGWNLLLALKRRDGRASVYCRRYVSPSGQHFVTCKDVASYLQSYFGYADAHQSKYQGTGTIQQNYLEASGSHAGFVQKADDTKHSTISISTLPSSSVRNAHEGEVSLSGIDNLAEVQVRDLFECYKCNMIFDEKDLYLHHLLSFHQRTTRRFRLGTSVGEGVIIKDGKFECQFCHKVFQERRSYNGHVGNHVKNFVRNSKESLPVQVTVQKTIEFPTADALSSRISKMDALVEIAHNSILETSEDGPSDKPNAGSSPKKQNEEEPNDKVISSPSEIINSMTERSLDQEVTQHDHEYMMTESNVEKIDGISDVGNDVNMVCTTMSEHSELGEVERHGTSQLEIDVGNSLGILNQDVVEDTLAQTVEKNVIQSGDTGSAMTSVQLLNCFPAFAAISNKSLDNIGGFEELRFEEIESLSPSLLEVTMDLASNLEMEEGFNSPEATMLMSGEHQLITACVWCRAEFNHEATDLEAQSDSIGFMCPTCKVKISGHLESGLSINSNHC